MRSRHEFKLALVGVLAIVALSLTATALTRSGAVTIEMRVWQDVDDPLTHYVSARPEGGDWRTLGTVPCP